MLIATDISSLAVVSPAPAAPVAASSAQTPGNEQANASQSSIAPQADAAQGNSQNQQQGGNTTGQAQDNDQFSKLLNAKQSDAQTPVAASGQSAPANASANANNSGKAASASGNVSGNASGNAVALVVLSQLQSLAGDNTQSPTATATQTAPVTPLQDAAFLQQLQQLLQQLLAQSQSASGNTPQPALVAAAQDTGAQDAGAQDAPQPQSNAKSGQDAASLPQLLAQLAAMLQSLTAPLAQQTSVPLTASTQTDASIDANGGSSSNGAPDLSARLTQLLQTLQQQLAATTGTNDSTTPTATAAATATPLPASFDATLNNLLQQTDVKATLQAALSDVTQLLTTAPVNKSGGNTGNNDSSNSSPSTGNLPQALSAPAPQAPAAPDTSFVKLLPAASSIPPAVDQVLVQIKTAADTNANQIKIQLDPAELGKVTVQMNTGTDGKTGITITADNRQTLAMLQNEARSLESALRDIGLKTGTGGLNFNLSGQQQQNPGNTGKNAGYTQVAAVTDEDIDYQSAVTQVYRYTAQDGLDIRV